MKSKQPSPPEQEGPPGSTAEYVPVKVEAARFVADHFNKQVVVILAIDRPFEKTHITTYGQQPQDKVEAAEIGDVLGDALTRLAGKPPESFEDFRRIDAARATRALELLERLATTVRSLSGPTHPAVTELVDQAVALLGERKRPPV